MKKAVPADVAVEVIRLVAAVEARLDRIESARIDSNLRMENTIRVREPDLIEYLERYRPANNAERVAATAMFLREQGFHSFDRPYVRAIMRKFGLAPANLPRDVATARSNGWLEESSVVPGEFSLTSAGIAVVTGGFGRPRES